MATYTYAQLEGLWLNAGGDKSLAPVMAAIAEAESGGNSDAQNPSGASGLWQILGNPFPGNPFDPATNARMAVAKYKSQGLGAWVTYTSGAYKAYLSSKTTPDANVPGSPTAQTTAAAAASGTDCLVGGQSFLGVVSLPCLFSRANARAFIGAGLVVTGGVLGLAGLALVAAAVGVKAAGPLGNVAEGVGGALLLVPGADIAGGALVAGGATAKQVGKGQAKQVAAKKAKRRESEDRRREKQLGQPRENPNMEVRGGTVRQTDAQRDAQRRREQGAARARARRSVSPGGTPASPSEAGF